MMMEDSGAVMVGDMAPEFTLPSLRGTQISLSSYRGKQDVVLWFSRGFTCNFCRNYMLSVIDAYPALQAADIEVITGEEMVQLTTAVCETGNAGGGHH